MSTYYNATFPTPLEFENCPSWLMSYLRNFFDIEGRSRKSVNTYFVTLRQFCQFVHFRRIYHKDPAMDQLSSTNISKMDMKEVLEVNSEDIKEYLFYLTNVLGNEKSSRRTKLSILRDFYGSLVLEGDLAASPCTTIQYPKLDAKLPVYLTPSECQTLLDSIDGENQIRDYAIVLIFLTTGIRLSELVGLNVTDRSGQTLRIRGKGGKEREVYLSEAAIHAWEDYEEAYRNPVAESMDRDKDAFFISRRQKCRLTTRAVEKMLEKQILKAGLSYKPITPHKLRHTAATTLVNAGAGIQDVQILLGHASSATTEKYAHLSNKVVQKTVENSPLATLGAEHIRPNRLEEDSNDTQYDTGCGD